MNKRLFFIGIMLLVGLTFSGCVWYGGHGYGYHDYSYGVYSHGGYYSHGYDRPYGNHHDWDDRHH